MKEPLFPILFVDDEEDILNSYKLAMLYNGMNNVILCSDSTKAGEILESQRVAAVVLDLNMPEISGQELLEQIKSRHPGLPVVIVTGNNDVETAVKCIKSGAFDYLLKPVNESQLLNSIRLVLKMGDLTKEVEVLRHQLLNPRIVNEEAFSHIITKSRKMFSIFQYIEAIAESPEPVFITGESGVGKELAALAIHRARKEGGEFIPVNIAGLDDMVFTDTLFGHKKGAYTGADSIRKGLIEKAAGGTLFLDEIGDLNIQSQLKLLRLIQEKEFYPLGSDQPSRSRARIVTATNRTIESLRESPNFRNDLYYRLNIHHIHIPPLRERKEDLPLLIDHFISCGARDTGKEISEVPGKVYSYLEGYNFPGNIRELRSIIFDLVTFSSGGRLPLERVKARLEQVHPVQEESGNLRNLFNSLDLLPTLKETRRELIKAALDRAGGVQATAARILGITPQALSKDLKSQR